MKTVIIDGVTLSEKEVNLLAQLIEWGFDSGCEDFSEEEDQKYRGLVDKILPNKY